MGEFGGGAGGGDVLMIAQEDPILAPWIYGIVNHKPTRSGDFLRTIAKAALRADYVNYEILRPALLELHGKYPEYHDPDAVVKAWGGF